jgi:acyl carrier protein
MAQDIENAVITAILRQKRLDAATITRDSVLSELGITSLDAITIVYDIEEQFDIEVQNETLEGLNTVGDIVDSLVTLSRRQGMN